MRKGQTHRKTPGEATEIHVTLIMMAFIKEETEDLKIENVFSLKHEETEEQTKKEENKDLKIENVLSLKHEETEEHTDLMPLKEENQELKEIEEKDQCKRQDFMDVEKSTQTETTSSRELVQKTKSNSNFTCSHCGKSFNQKGNLETHMKIHTGEKPFKCDQCGKRFIQKASLKSHMRNHTGEKPFKCDQCGESFKFKETLNSHLIRHTGEKPFACDHCGKSFIRKVNLNAHKKRKHSDLMALEEENQKLKEIEEKDQYKRQDFMDLEKSIQTETTYKKKVTKTSQKKVQKTKSNRDFTCSHCGKSFYQTHNLNKHKLIHTGVKPFKCDQCGKSFNQKANLNSHMRVHTGEKPFTCVQCERSFSYKRNLKCHLQTCGKKLQCSKSGKRLREEGGRKLNCDQCNKTFILPSHLQIHLKSHADVRRHLCSLCGRRFKWLSGLKWHQKIRSCVKLRLRSRRS